MEEKPGPSESGGKGKKATSKSPRGKKRIIRVSNNELSSCDELPRPRGPIKKRVGQKAPKFQPGQVPSSEEVDKILEVPRRVAKRVVPKSKLEKTKSPSHGRKKPSPKVTAAKRRAANRTSPPGATGVIEPSENRSEMVQPEVTNAKPWWKSLFWKIQDDERVFKEVHEDELNQLELASNSREVADTSPQTDASAPKFKSYKQ
uniref:Uncharacterized protein LOC108052793 n=1 Tax=Drosophila rhopaloa TaxID=1041015 RepID=A0A6P4FJU0_DRORH